MYWRSNKLALVLAATVSAVALNSSASVTLGRGAGPRGPESQGQLGEGRGSWQRAVGQPGCQNSFVELRVQTKRLSPVL